MPAPEDWAGKPSLLKGIQRKAGLQGWTEERWTELRATYYGMCARVDHQFGLLMEALREAGIYDDTAVFVFSDHGDFTGDYGLVEKTQNTFEDCLSRVPFVIKPPAWAPVQPRVSEALVELIDFPATVEALTGIEPQHTHFGRSLLPVLAGETDEHRDAVFCEGGRLHGEVHCMELESTQYQDTERALLAAPGLAAAGGAGAHQGRHVPHQGVQVRAPPVRVGRAVRPARRPGRGAQPHRRSGAGAGVLAQLKERLLTFYLETADVVPHDTDQRG